MLLNRHKNKAPVVPEVVSAEIVQTTEKVVIAKTETTTEELTKTQIIEQLEAKGIKYDARQKKESLLELLKAGN